MYKDKFYTLYNGVKIPAVGFGTWQTKGGEEAYNSVLWALEAGYRHIDTAYVYENEESVGRAVRDFGIDRDKVFITTKLPSEIKSYDGALTYFDMSLKNLGVDYLDLYLIHAPWPWSNVGEDCTAGNIEAWKALIKLYNEGKIRAIGVSNFHKEHITPLIEATGVKPMANQIRYFVGNTQEKITSYCQQSEILIEAYSPLAMGELVDNKLLESIAQNHGVKVSEVCLAYCLQKGTLPLPKSVHRERIFDNFNISTCLTEEEMRYLDGLYHIASTRKFRD